MPRKRPKVYLLDGEQYVRANDLGMLTVLALALDGVPVHYAPDQRGRRSGSFYRVADLTEWWAAESKTGSATKGPKGRKDA